MNSVPQTGGKAVSDAERQAAEQSIAVLDCILDPIFLVSTDSGLITHCNSAALRWYGSRREELVGQSFSIFFDNHDDIRRDELIERVRVHRYVFMEQSFVERSGRRVQADLSASMFRWQNRDVILVNLRDAEERLAAQRMEVQMRETEIRLKTIEDLSHDINNPLQALLLNAEASRDATLRGHVEEIANVLRKMREDEQVHAPVPRGEAVDTDGPAGTVEVAADPKRIQVADDAAGIRAAIRMMIERRFPDISVDVAADGEESLALFKEKHPAVIILDMVMPKAGGDVVFHEIRKYCRQHHWEEPRILFCTGYVPPADITAELAASTRHVCLLKPVATAELLATVAELLPAAKPPVSS